MVFKFYRLELPENARHTDMENSKLIINPDYSIRQLNPWLSSCQLKVLHHLIRKKLVFLLVLSFFFTKIISSSCCRINNKAADVWCYICLMRTLSDANSVDAQIQRSYWERESRTSDSCRTIGMQQFWL